MTFEKRRNLTVFTQQKSAECQKGSDPIASRARPRRNASPTFSVSATEKPQMTRWPADKPKVPNPP